MECNSETSLLKKEQKYHSKFLFLLLEGANKLEVCKHNRIDQDDYFGLPMTTAKSDSIGAVKVVKIENELAYRK